MNKIFISGVIYKEVWFVYPSHGKIFITLTLLQVLPTKLDFIKRSRAYLLVQWLKLQASSAGRVSSIPGQGIKILHPVKCCASPLLPNKKGLKGNVSLQIFPFDGIRIFIYYLTRNTLTELGLWVQCIREKLSLFCILEMVLY